MQQIVSKSQFKAQMLEYFRQLEKTKQPLVITHSGKPVAKVIPYKKESDSEAILKSLKGTVTYHGDIIKPLDEEWDVLK
ncbi:MAG: type II toxin-antitoxin system Phd/YefM family antitoxin [Candidatus Levybacteria bacterium]|nr:type II toxin-antitoxin system Phd/YefM family antitoxin [Candidatus Levybacteria bacterium]